MAQHDWLAERFEENRPRLRAVAYRMLGSLSEADDAVQEAWLRLSRTSTGDVDNLGGWLTTVVGRICLDMLRARESRREDSLDTRAPAASADRAHGADPENEALLADSVGLALLVVLEKLAPAERIAFVLHDMFDVPFDEIAPMVGRTPVAARQLASRARRRVQGGGGGSRSTRAEIAAQRATVDAFLAALRAGDLQGLLAVLDPDLLVTADAVAARPDGREVRGAEHWASQAVKFAQSLRAAQPAIVNGSVGLVMAPRGKLARVLTFRFAHGKIVGIDVIAEPARLRELDLTIR
jgi:RNA polymerase sigma-70 factor (ECF subfamily)